MRIVFYYESIDLGGQQTQTYQLMRALAAFGHQVTWIYLSGVALRSKVQEIGSAFHLDVPLASRDYIKRPWRIVRILNRLTRALRELEADLVVSGSGLGSIIAGIASRTNKIYHVRLVGCSLVQVEKTLYRWYSVLQVDRVIDKYLAWPAVFVELSKKGVHHSKFVELNNAVDTTMFFPLSSEEIEQTRLSLGFTAEDFIIGWVGRLAPNMQVWNTVKLVALLKQRGLRRVRLLVVGGGVSEDAVRLEIEKNGLRDECRLLGWVPMEDVNKYINIMDVIPLLEEDPQGGSIMREAMACGRVALSVEGVSGTQGRFMKAGCAILVKPLQFVDDACQEVLFLAQNPQVMRKMGDQARRYAVSEMSFEKQATTLLNVAR